MHVISFLTNINKLVSEAIIYNSLQNRHYFSCFSGERRQARSERGGLDAKGKEQKNEQLEPFRVDLWLLSFDWNRFSLSKKCFSKISSVLASIKLPPKVIIFLWR